MRGALARRFNDWYLIDREQRAFVRVGLRLIADAYQRIWDDVGARPSDGEDDLVDEFEKEVEGLWEAEYAWMHCAAVIRDVVTSYEVYLERAREEIYRRRGLPYEIPERTPDFHNVLRPFFSWLGATIDPPTVREVRRLRHVLTHRRGELRTERLRQQFDTSSSKDLFAPFDVELDADRVLALMDDLGRAVRQIDAVAYDYGWGNMPLPSLDSPARVAGVDGYRGGWVMVFFDAAGLPTARVARRLEELLDVDADVIAVDIPIGLPESDARAADVEAHAFVGARRSSVFPTPPRAVLVATTFDEANRVSRELSGKGISKQSFALRSRILEVDALAQADERIIEVHPEVSFCELAGAPLEHTKHSAAGLAERRRLLRRAAVVIPTPPRGVPEADLLDAAIAAWSAARFARRQALALPEGHANRIGAIWR